MSDITIALDAGHGGSDPGATYNGRAEKDDTLRLTRAVGKILEMNGINVYYVRDNDEYETPFKKATDANNSKEMLQKALREVVPDTYNMVSVDGDTSTNDTVLLLANGLAGNPEITEENEDYKIFKEALFEVNKTQAMHIAGDGEGATALFEVTIQGAESKEQAVTLAKSVITSSLTKAAIFGHDANWGRILCAMGYSGAKFDPENVDLYFESAAGKLQIITKGVAVDYSEEEATKILSEPKVTAIADIHMGEAAATAWGCDLTYDYVKINADYRS